MDKNYHWKFCTTGGVTRVNIADGKDIAHLGELDQKLWTVLSCPVDGLELDKATLSVLDADGDGKIKVGEVVKASEWLCKVLKDPEILVKEGDEIALDAFNTENEEGQRLYASARQILANLGLEKDAISLADTSDSVAIFGKTRFNGDGIITEASAETDSLRETIAAIRKYSGSSMDRSGEEGVNADQVEAFYSALAAYEAWIAKSEADKDEIFPFGDSTADALASCEAVKEKIDDYFMRCKLVAFDADCGSALDVSVEKIGAISDRNMAECAADIASYPLSRVNGGNTLPFAGINPAWQGAFGQLKSLVFDVLYPEVQEIDQAQWEAVLAKFDAYKTWTGAKDGAAVEELGIDKVRDYLAKGEKDQLLALIEQDKALEAESTAIDDLGRFLHLRRDFYTFLKNYVTFSDFYNPSTLALFQAGKLYIDQRCCELCIKVSDMGKSVGTAGLSGIFLIYCTCVSKTKGTAMDIVAAMTDGDIKNIREGKNGIFYDREGNDWDATITKVVDNPISIRQAFWSPYRKLSRFIEDKIAKNAAEKDSKVMSDATTKIDTASVDGKKQPFDIAKYAGIFAAVSVAIAALGGALALIANAFKSIKLWQVLVIILVIMLIISAPSMIMAWLKLRKRNLAPVLNANGWAINSNVLVNILFGATLTSIAKVPKIKSNDPFVKKVPAWKKILRWILFLAAAAFAVLYFTDNLKFMGITRHKKAATEEVTEAPAIQEDTIGKTVIPAIPLEPAGE